MINSCEIKNAASPILKRRRITDMICSPSSVLTMNQEQCDTVVELLKDKETNKEKLEFTLFEN